MELREVIRDVRVRWKKARVEVAAQAMPSRAQLPAKVKASDEDGAGGRKVVK